MTNFDKSILPELKKFQELILKRKEVVTHGHEKNYLHHIERELYRYIRFLELVFSDLVQNKSIEEKIKFLTTYIEDSYEHRYHKKEIEPVEEAERGLNKFIDARNKGSFNETEFKNFYISVLNNL